jgi:hypothetical protein
MFDTFFNAFRNPWLMIAGILLISVPIIIHLINRIRFKRIRWAAMEFLLKSQKRNRRRLILEQLLLLALRCLLVALVGLLVARFVTDIGRLTAQDTRHYVLIDATLSMNDRWQDQGKDLDCFEVAKAFTRAIAKTAVEEDTPQHLRVVLLSDLEHPIFDQRLNDQSRNDLEAVLADPDLKPTLMHIDPAVGFKAANDFFAQHSEDKKVMHFLSDLREKDWNNTASDLSKHISDLTQDRHANVFLMDCAHPFRNENQQAALHHDNLAITDLQPDTRFASKDGQLVEFILSIQNYSPSERKDYPIKVYREGEECFEVPPQIPSIPVGHSEFKFSLGFSKDGFNQVTAVLGEEKTGLQADNIRHTVVDVRTRIPVLVVDGGFPDVDGEYSDTRFVREALKAAKGYEVVSANVDALEKPELNANYPSMFILNVPQFKSPKALANLEEYVRKGGRVAFFLGDRVQAAEYNKTLYNGGNGLFPVPLASQPTLKLKKEAKEDLLSGNGRDQFKVFVRIPDHPIVHGLASVSEILRYLLIDQYYPTLPRFQWAGKDVEELATLPSRKELTDFAPTGMDLLQKLPIDKAQYEKFQPALVRHRDNIKKALLGTYLYELAAALDAVLTDRGDPEPDAKKRDPKRPNLVVDFWSLPELQELKSDFEQFRDSIKFGDPLIVTKRFGKGRVVAFMTSASTRWNDWAGGSVASFTFPIIVTDLQKYLTGGNEESNRNIGDTVTLTRDSTHFEPRMHRTHYTGFEERKGGAEKDNPKNGMSQDMGEQKVEPNKDGELVFGFIQNKKSGMDGIILYPRGDPVPPPETKAYVFNVDTEAESDLRRAAKDKLERNPSGGAQDQGKVKLVIGSDRLFKQGTTLEEIQSERKSDWSEEPWFYLLFIVILIIEQALAVHLSFHLKGGAAAEAQLPAQVLRSQGVAS